MNDSLENWAQSLQRLIKEFNIWENCIPLHLKKNSNFSNNYMIVYIFSGSFSYFAFTCYEVITRKHYLLLEKFHED